MVERHHQHSGQEFEQTLGDNEGQRSLLLLLLSHLSHIRLYATP